MRSMGLFLNEHLKLQQNDFIIVAVSTGVDSMVLLHLLQKVQSEMNYHICVAHVHHNKREQSDLEYNFLKDYCKNNDLTFEAIVLPKEYEGNFHDYAHQKRYMFFDELARKYKAQYVFTAHHGDDQIETILQRLIRGSSFTGYAGIKPISHKHSYTLVRPMLELSKQEILDYANTNQIKYFEDLSNVSRDYMRNRIRHDIVPLLKEENAQVIAHFNKFSNQILDYHEYIQSRVKQQYSIIVTDDRIDLNLYFTLDSFMQKEVLKRYLKIYMGSEIKHIVDLHLEGIYNIINSSKPNLEYDLPMNNKVIKEYNYLYLTNDTNKELNDYICEFEELFEFKYGYIKREALDALKNHSNDIIRLDSKEISLPIKIRYRQDGDHIQLLGTNGKKKLKDIFIDEKIPLSKRNEIPIVVDNEDQILWIPSIKKSKYDKKYNQHHDIVLKYYYAN